MPRASPDRKHIIQIAILRLSGYTIIVYPHANNGKELEILEKHSKM